MNFNKIMLLNRRQWRENNRSYGIGLLAITGILLFLFLIVWHWRDSFAGDAHRGIFLIGLFAGGCIFGSSLLQDVIHPAKGMWLTGIPASAGDKLSISVMYATILYSGAYVSLFYITEGFFSWLIKRDGSPVEHTNLLHNGFYNFLFKFINFQLFVLLGSLSFKKGALAKTILLMILYFAIFYNGNNYLLMLMTGEKSIDGSGIYNYFQFRHGGENVYVYLPDSVQTIVSIFSNYLLPVILYYIIYEKFRETEI